MFVSRFYRSALLVILLFAELLLGVMDPVSAAPSAAPTNPGTNSVQAQVPTSDCQGSKGFGLNAANKNLLNQLQNAIGSGGTISCHDYTGKVRFLSTEPGKPLTRAANLASKASPEEATRNFLTSYGSLFGLADQSKELKVMREMTGDQRNNYVR